MLEVIISSVIGTVCICGGGIFAYYNCYRPRDDEAYVLDTRVSEHNFTFNEIYLSQEK